MTCMNETYKRLSILIYLSYSKSRKNQNTMSKNKVITTQFKLIEMSQTRARGCIEKIYLTENKTAFDLHVSVSKKPKFPRSVTLVF